MIDSLLLHADIAFFALLAAFYVIDCGLLLHPNDILLIGSRNQAFAAITPLDGFLFNRKHAVFPGLLRPNRLIVSLSWPTKLKGRHEGAETFVSRLTTNADRLAPLRLGGSALLLMMFVALPASYVFAGEGLMLVVVVVVTYALVVAMALTLLVVRTRLELRWGPTLALIFESLVCPPVAINLYRKTLLAGSKRSGGDLLAVSRALLGDSRFDRLQADLRQVAEWPTARTDSPNFAQWRAKLGEPSDAER